MDPLSHPEYLLLLLEDHTRLFLVLAALTSYPDDALCAFYDASLNISCRVLSSEDGPQANFAAFVECHSRPSAQPTISPLRGAHAWAHRWRRARAHRDRRAIVARIDRAEDRCRAGAANVVSQGAWAGNNARLEAERHGRCEHGEELRHLHRGWAHVPAPRKRPPEPTPSSACSPKASSRARASRAPSSVGSRSWGQPWKSPSSPLLLLSPLSLRLHRGLTDPRLCVGRRHHLLRLGPPDPPHRPCSSALHLHLGLLLHLLRHRWSAPWSQRPFLLHGSSLRRLHCGPPLWLWPGSRQAPPALGPSCLSPGSSLLHHLPSLCLPAPSRVSVLLLSLLLSSRPPLPFGCFYGVRTHLPGGGDMSGSWTCLCVFLLPMCSLWPSFSLTLIVDLIPGVSHLPPWLSCL